MFIFCVTWRYNVNCSRNTSAAAEADIIYLIEDISKQFDIEVEGHHDQDQPVAKTKSCFEMLAGFQGQTWRDGLQIVDSESRTCNGYDSEK